jgi:hyperosmotically inducible protein
MTTHFESRSVAILWTAALALSAAGCNKPAETTGATAPPTTVGTEIDDTLLTASVKSALLADTKAKSFDFKVETRKGEVQLSGFVENQGQIDRALEVVRGVEDVQRVSNEMSLKK